MSVLNQLFSRGLLGARCKTCLNLVISRIKLLQNRRDVQLKQMRREIAQFLQTGQEAIARIRVEHVIREQNVWAAYEILEMFCEFILVRIPILESQRECPTELREAIASILFAAPHCSDLPDLLQVKKLFTAKYGREFVSAVSELRPDTSVNRTVKQSFHLVIIEKLTVSAPSPQTKLKLLKEIAQEYNLAWDSSETEVEFSKKHDDLLDGSRKIRGGPLPSEAPKRQQPLDSPHRNGSPNTHSLQSSNPTTQKSINPDGVMESSSGKNSNEGSSDDHRTITSSQSSSDVLEKARAAISAAERASAAARAAALLADSKFGFFKLEGKS